MEMAKTFSGKQLHGVAAGLGPSEQVAGRAALATTGLTLMSVSGAIRTANALHADPSLTERNRPIITAVICEMSAEERGGHGEAAPKNHTRGGPAGTQQDPLTASAAGEPDNVPAEDDKVRRRRATRAGGPSTMATDGSMSDEEFLRLQGVDGPESTGTRWLPTLGARRARSSATRSTKPAKSSSCWTTTKAVRRELDSY